MILEKVDTKKAYRLIQSQITSLELPPGAPIDEHALAVELELSHTAVREALKLLLHDQLVVVRTGGGLFVSQVNLRDLAQLSELRLALEPLCARLAAERATHDDVAVLEALLAALEQAHDAPVEENGRLLFELDHKFHQAIAQAAQNRYLARTLEQYFGLSLRLWSLALPQLDFLPAAVEEHRDLVEAIHAGEADRAAEIMYHHVVTFYEKVSQFLADKGVAE